MKNIGREKKVKEKKDSIFTPETLGVVLILFASLALICLISRSSVFGVIGLAVAEFLLGVAGYFAYPLFVFTVFYGFLLISGKKTGFTNKRKFFLALAIICIAIIVHQITMGDFNKATYAEYLSASYNRDLGGAFKSSGGGVITGLIAGLLVKVLSPVGLYVVVSALTLFIGYILYLDFSGKNPKAKADAKTEFNGTFAEQETENAVESKTEQEVSAISASVQKPIENKPAQKLFVADPNSFALKTRRDLKANNDDTVQFAYTENGLGVPTQKNAYSATYDKDIQSKLNYIKTPAKIDLEKTLNQAKSYSTTSAYTPKVERDERVVNPAPIVSEPIVKTEPVVEEVKEESAIPFYEVDTTEVKDDAISHAENFRTRYANIEELTQDLPVEEPEEQILPVEEQVIEEQIPEIIEETDDEPSTAFYDSEIVRNIFAEKTEESIPKVEEEPKEEEPEEFEPPRRTRSLSEGRRFGFSERATPVEEPKESEPEQVVEEKSVKEIPPINREYFRPSWDLLESYTPPTDLPKENHEERQEIIKQTLEEFGISVEPQGYIQGPSITRYEIKMPAGVSVKRVLNYDDDLQMRLAARNGVRIEAPIPGKNLVGIEVANSTSVMVGLKEVLMGMAGQTFKPDSLIFALGKDIVGNSKYDDLSKGPHYLIAGSSGSGKSVCLNVMIVSLIMRYSPEELRFILIDPKRVEMRKYEHIPHLMVDEIITEPKKALAVLQWSIDEMERRYAMFEQAGSFIDGIGAYNQYVASDTVPKMPRLVIVIDEFGDLMANVKKDLEVKIQILTQKARAAGIHIVLATQRPSANVVTGVIKTNLPSRIAFKVGNYTDSMIILDGKGAEKLLGNGDMLYKNSTMPDNERYQGAFISAREINGIVSYIIEKNKAYFDDDLKEYLEKVDKPKQEERPASEDGDGGGGVINDANTDLLIRALSLAINAGGISISQVQRRFQIGYIRAAGIVDKMEELGYISGNEGGKTRKVYITREEFEEKYGPVSD